MSGAELLVVGVERVEATQLQHLRGCVAAWRAAWGIHLAVCLRLEDDVDAFVVVLEPTLHAAQRHLEDLLRETFPEHVIVPRAYVQGFRLPLYALGVRGLEQMERERSRVQRIERDARAGRLSPLLPPRSPGASGVAAWRTWGHARPPGQGSYLICDTCGESTGRHPTVEQAWAAAHQDGWRLWREAGLSYCLRCVENGNAGAAERQHYLPPTL